MNWVSKLPVPQKAGNSFIVQAITNFSTNSRQLGVSLTIVERTEYQNSSQTKYLIILITTSTFRIMYFIFVL